MRLRVWLWSLGIVIALAAAVVFVERVTRPAAETLSVALPLPTETTRRSRGPVPPAPASPTYDEVFAEGARLGDEIASAFPGSGEALALSGRVFFTFGKSSQAKAWLEKAVTLDPMTADAWLAMAELARLEGDFPKSVECMRRLAKANPRLAKEKVFVLADSLLKLGSAKEAVDVLEDCGKDAPLPTWACVMLGRGYYQLKDYQRSADQYRKALDDPKESSVAHYGLSSALMRLGRQDEARKYREDYARVEVKNLAVFDRMQHAGTQEERHEGAGWYPFLAQFHLQAGRLYANHGDAEQAEKHWLRAWALAPDRPEPRQLLGSLHKW